MRRRTTKDLLYPRIWVEDGLARGADGRPLARDQVVRRRAHYSASLKTEVPGDVGRIVDIFRRSMDSPVLIDIRRDRENGAAGLATMPASEARRSAAPVRGTTREDWHG